MFVSIIVVTYNSSDYIQDFLESLLSFTKIQNEVIIYDNASSDRTVSIILDNFPSVRLICGDTNIGFASANNAAAKTASGQVLVFLNPDVYLTDGWLEPLIDALDLELGIGAASPMILFADRPELVNACGNNIYASGVTYCNHYGRRFYSSDPYQVAAVSGAAFAIQRSLFEDIGGFEDCFFMYYEDTDLSLRIQCAGYSIVVVPESKVLHDYRPLFSPEKTYYLERNRYLSILSIIKWQMLLVMVPALVISEIGSWAFCFTRGRLTVLSKINSWREIVRYRHWIRKRRRQSQIRNCQSNLSSVFSSELKIEYVDNNISWPVLLYQEICQIFALPVRIAGYLGKTKRSQK